MCRCVYTYVYPYSCVSASACAHAYVCRKVVDWGVFLSHSLPQFLRGSLIEPGAHKFSCVGCPASLRDPASLHSQNWD